MVEPATVRRLLETIELRLIRLEEARAASLEAYLASRDLQDIVERNLEIAIQASIDLGLHVLADRPTALPETNRGVFRSLAEQGLLETELSRRLEEMAGFRNLLVHGYASIAPAKVHATLSDLADIRAYVRQLTSALAQESPEDRDEASGGAGSA